MHFSVSEIEGLIAHRRTIYPEQFSDRKVHRELVEKLLNAARWAPNHGMTQPWRFVVFTGDARMELSTFLGNLYTELHPGDAFNAMKHQKMVNRPLQSSVVMAVCMARDPKEKIPELEEVEAVACAVQNMALMAAAYGLGLFWATPKLVYHARMHAHLELPPASKCLGLLYLGYPAIEWPKGQRKPIEYFTTWKGKD
jgi:nitroreductase